MSEAEIRAEKLLGKTHCVLGSLKQPRDDRKGTAQPLPVEKPLPHRYHAEPVGSHTAQPSLRGRQTC